jgi:poly(ADP-ribose) glycohydrolase ARH3
LIPVPAADRFEGALLGLALGDALGAPHEGGPLERLLWRCIGTTRTGAMRWTDDTQMSLDLAESLVACGAVDPDDIARRFAAGYRWSRGYGPSAAKVLRRIGDGMDWRRASRSVHAQGSFGNGAAMRAPVVGLWCAARPDALVDATVATAGITHAHPLGVEGAVAIAVATTEALGGRDGVALLDAAATACTLAPYPERFALARGWMREGAAPAPREVARRLGHGVAAPDSCVTAVYLAARFLHAPFAAMHAFAVACRGDVDTIAAMAGALWGAANGAAALPAGALAKLEDLERIRTLAAALHHAVQGNQPT